MEQNNLTNKNEEKIEPLETQGEQISDLEKPQESFEDKDKQVSVVDDAEEVLKIQVEVQKLETQVQSTLDGVNQINENLGLPPKKVEEIPSLQNKIAKIFNLKNLLKAATVAGLMFGATSEGLSQNKSEKNAEKEHKEWVEKQYQLYKKGALKEGSKVRAPDGSVYVLGPLKIENLKGQEEIKSINISSYFKTGTVEFVDAKAEENAKQSIRDFLITVGGLENSTIKVIGSYSKDKPWGNVSAQHPYGDKNTDLANKRKAVCRSLFENVLKETYSEDYIKNLSIEEISKGIGLSDNFPEDEIKKMSDLERNKKINSYQGMSIEIIKKIIKEPETLEKLTLNKEEMEFLNTIIVVVDESNSMVRDAKKVKSIVEKVNKYNKEKNNKSIEIKKLEGGNKEAHIQTLKNILFKLDDTYQGKEILVITDEPDENFDSNSYDIAMGEVLKLSQEKGIKVVFKIFNPDESKSGSVSVVLDKTTIGVLKKPEKLNRKYFTVDDLKKAWYEGLVANSNSLTSN